MKVKDALVNWPKCNNRDCLFDGQTHWMDAYSDITFRGPVAVSRYRTDGAIEFSMHFRFNGGGDLDGDYLVCPIHVQLFWQATIHEDPL